MTAECVRLLPEATNRFHRFPDVEPIAIAGIVLAAFIAALAQAPNARAGDSAPKEAVDSGAIIMPPQTDPAAVKKLPANIDPGITAPARKKTRPKVPKNQQSKDASCHGPKALCKQSSPR